ncbi:hypothetical protein CAPI_06380 [Corynebacterium capitovis DSM 44611]|uniref:hypothetical protein n=1 Tax=Corynebacterium capitovis TaxID=131081 RepID=UPI00036D22E9|nr:hypothetical protein [Corynebacterium capitovis]WKD57817.1 hypothetical protein CAPI_06380 [Corynebacterium capitovis DSM 44611]
MTAFGLGDMPGCDLAQAADVVLSESPLPYLPQLPQRGLDAVGRTAALLDIPIDRGPRGWRVATQHRAAKDQMPRDLDVLEQLWAGRLSEVKVQLVGPWTLAAEIEMANGHRMMTDAGARRDLVDALLGAVEEHRTDVEKRLRARSILQLDEPRLADVIAGTVRGSTDFETIPAVPEPEETLSRFGDFLLNAPTLIDVPWAVTDITRAHDGLARALERGTRLAVAPVEPKRLWRVFDELRIDPGEARLDVWAKPAPTLTQAARNLAAAREMAEGLA